MASLHSRPGSWVVVPARPPRSSPSVGPRRARSSSRRSRLDGPLTGGGSEIPSTRLHRHPGERGLRLGMTPVLWGQKWPEQREATPQVVPAWGYGSVRAESPHPRCLRGGARWWFLPGFWVRSACYFRASCPLGSFAGVFRPAFGLGSQECSSLRARFRRHRILCSALARGELGPTSEGDSLRLGIAGRLGPPPGLGTSSHNLGRAPG